MTRWLSTQAVKPHSRPSRAVMVRIIELTELVEQTFMHRFGTVEELCGPASRCLVGLLNREGIPALLAYDGEHVWAMIGRVRADPTIRQFDERAKLVGIYCGHECDQFHYSTSSQWRRELALDCTGYGPALRLAVGDLFGRSFAYRLWRDHKLLIRSWSDDVLNLSWALNYPDEYAEQCDAPLPTLIKV